MKKFLFLAIAVLMATAANAQLMTSRTFFGKERNTVWFLRAGMSINNVTNVEETTSAVGYDVNIGFQKPIASSAVYWGMDLGSSTRGFGYEANGEDKTAMMYNVRFTPLTFGYKYSVTDNFKIDGHLGAYLSYDFAQSEDAEDLTISGSSLEEFDAGMQVGLGVWFKRFNIDFTYQRGFCAMADLDSDKFDTPYSSNFLIRLGIAF